MKLSTYLCLLSLAVITGLSAESCSCSEEYVREESVSSRVKDKSAYKLGEEHAAKLLEVVDNEAAVQDGLLDVRARMSNIRSKLGAQSATDYERGFTDYIRANNDSLAGILF